MSVFNECELQLLHQLDRAGVIFAVIGGAAVMLHGHQRERPDLDLLLEPDPENIDRLAAIDLTWLKFNSRMIATLKVKNARLDSPERRLDMLTVLKGVPTSEVMNGRVFRDIGGLCVPVISKCHLIIEKIAVGEGKDLEDVAALRRL